MLTRFAICVTFKSCFKVPSGESEAAFNQRVSDLNNLISELEGLQRSAPAKELVRGLNFAEIKERKIAIIGEWEVS